MCSTKIGLENHILQHHVSYFCTECKQCFNKKEDLEKHMETHMIKCKSCIMNFGKEEALKIHVKLTHELNDKVEKS